MNGNTKRCVAGLLALGASACGAAPLWAAQASATPTSPAAATPAPAAQMEELTRRARAGDKRAQFELGERHERGDGVSRDRQRAIALYRAAAQDSGGTRMMFVPQPNGSVSAVPVASGTFVPELPQARQALQRLARPSSNRMKRITERQTPSLESELRDQVNAAGPDASSGDRHPAIRRIDGPFLFRAPTLRHRKTASNTEFCRALSDMLKKHRDYGFSDCYEHTYVGLADDDDTELVALRYKDSYAESDYFIELDQGHGYYRSRPPFSLPYDIEADDFLCGRFYVYRFDLSSGRAVHVITSRARTSAGGGKCRRNSLDKGPELARHNTAQMDQVSYASARASPSPCNTSGE